MSANFPHHLKIVITLPCVIFSGFCLSKIINNRLFLTNIFKSKFVTFFRQGVLSHIVSVRSKIKNIKIKFEVLRKNCEKW